MNLSKWPQFSDEEISAVSNVLKSGNVNAWTGNKVRSFENDFASYIDSKYSIVPPI